ncbi:SDR family oxidoreductase [Rhizobium sp. CRIBSB]|nr:SDR family oxidoreductase [Rhizobium sp. CRIBSB]
MPIILIVGGAMGSGGALARLLLSRGSNVVLVDPVASMFDSGPVSREGRLFPLDMDLTRPDLTDVALAFCHDVVGSPDGLFVNMHRITIAPLEQWSANMFDADIAHNLTIPFFLARAVALDMMRRGGGSIVFTGSTAGQTGAAGKAPFHAAKAALTGLCRALADEFGPHGLRINCLMPGWIDSPSGGSARDKATSIPLRRLGRMEEVAAAAHLLLEQTYIHGTEFIVDGGDTAAAGLRRGTYEITYDRRIV